MRTSPKRSCNILRLLMSCYKGLKLVSKVCCSIQSTWFSFAKATNFLQVFFPERSSTRAARTSGVCDAPGSGNKHGNECWTGYSRLERPNRPLRSRMCQPIEILKRCSAHPEINVRGTTAESSDMVKQLIEVVPQAHLA